MPDSNNELASRLRVLEDIEAIKQVKAKYFWSIDNKDWDGLRQILIDDMQWHSGGKLRSENADHFVASVIDFLGQSRSVHRGCMPLIEITGPTTASGRWLLHDLVNFVAKGKQWEGYGYYHDEYRKGPDGKWRISSSKLGYFKR